MSNFVSVNRHQKKALMIKLYNQGRHGAINWARLLKYATLWQYWHNENVPQPINFSFFSD